MKLLKHVVAAVAALSLLTSCSVMQGVFANAGTAGNNTGNAIATIYNIFKNTGGIDLSNITTLGGNKITQWEAGKKYTYNIHIRYGGGITVHVITTEWNEVKAGTPGLIVS